MTDEGQNYTVYIGQDKDIVVTVADDVITDWTLGAYFRNRQTDSLVTTKTTETDPVGITIDSATQCTVHLTDADTDTWTPQDHTWSLWRIDGNSENPLSLGTVTVRRTSRGLAPE